MKRVTGLLNGNDQKTKPVSKKPYFDKEESKDQTEEPNVMEIPGTPFASVRLEDNHYEIVLGKHIVTDKKFLSHKAAQRYCNQHDWGMLLNIITAVVESIDELKRLQAVEATKTAAKFSPNN